MDDDERTEELGSLAAIYPEIQVDDDDPFGFTLEVPVNPATPVPVSFLAPSGQAPPNFDAASHAPGRVAAQSAGDGADVHQLSYLPSLVLKVCLPDGYPADSPPQITLSTSPQWLSRVTLKKLEDDSVRLWEEMLREVVMFAYINHIIESSENVFDSLDERGTLAVDSRHKIALLDYDMAAKRATFEKEIFHCGVCLGELP
jgi:E3 ubiquitin-protein ligase RNF14